MLEPPSTSFGFYFVDLLASLYVPVLSNGNVFVNIDNIAFFSLHILFSFICVRFTSDTVCKVFKVVLKNGGSLPSESDGKVC